MPHSLLILCSDHVDKASIEAYQETLIAGYFRNISADELRKMKITDLTAVCTLRGIYCVDSIVTEMRYKYCLCGQFDLAYVPPTVQKLDIQSCDQAYTVDTRKLPRAAHHIFLNNNLLHGTIDLTTLPENAVIVSFTFNSLSGPIDLTNLPKYLTSLGILQNSIQQKTVMYSKLPPGLKWVNLRGPHMHIRHLRGVTPEDRRHGKSVFARNDVRID